jgi:hypothetical protein
MSGKFVSIVSVATIVSIVNTAAAVASRKKNVSLTLGARSVVFTARLALVTCNAPTHRRVPAMLHLGASPVGIRQAPMHATSPKSTQSARVPLAEPNVAMAAPKASDACNVPLAPVAFAKPRTGTSLASNHSYHFDIYIDF